MLEQGARGALAALAEPHPRHHRAEVGSPDARYEARLARDRHVARARARDEREVLVHGLGPAQRSETARVRVDDPDGDRDGSRQTELRGRRRGQGPRGCAEREHAATDPAVLEQRVDAGGAPERLVEARLVRQVPPLAPQGADAARVVSGRTEHEVVGQIEGLTDGVEGSRQLGPQPRELGHLHLGRQPPPDVAQRLGAGRRQPLGLRRRAVIHPHDDVAVRRAVDVHGHGPRPRGRAATSEHVASNARPRTRSGGTFAAIRAARTARPAASHSSSPLCSAKSGRGRCSVTGAADDPRHRPARSNTPARTDSVPASTPTKSASSMAGEGSALSPT